MDSGKVVNSPPGCFVAGVLSAVAAGMLVVFLLCELLAAVSENAYLMHDVALTRLTLFVGVAFCTLVGILAGAFTRR